MKKTYFLMIFFVLISFCFVGCENVNTSNNEDKIQIISTIFPYYDFTNQICAENADVTMLLPPGSESHSYEPSAKDIAKIQKCDLFIYTGGESDAWVEDLLATFDGEINTLKLIDYVDGIMEDNEPVYDEHIWTSPKNAVIIADVITEKIIQIDPKNGDFYNAMSNNYIVELNMLDEDFTNFFSSTTNKTLIFGDRFPFKYFAVEYGLEYYAAFPGCSNETEPSAATMASLIDKVKSDNTKTIFYIEFSNHKIADAISEATGSKTAMLHSCNNVSNEDLENGATYLTIMRQNLDTLKEALK